MKQLEKFSLGIGDRFGRQGSAQLAALVRAKREGVTVVPVWNKSNREHGIVKTRPADVRREADAAVHALGWSDSYYVDADHIGLGNVEGFIEACDFFTLDVADCVGRVAPEAELDACVAAQKRLIGKLELPGLTQPVEITAADLKHLAAKYLLAVREAGKIYRRVAAARGAGNFVTEVSLDETDQAQSPGELYFLLALIAAEGIPAQTIAPKFTGRFNKGVDYVGPVERFAAEFSADLAVVARAVAEFGLPANLKLSVHSGSDKFSLYAPIRRALQTSGAGLHLKTAGTTWLEELIGLAAAGGEGLKLAQEVYGAAYARYDELAAPYATVIDIDRARLPAPASVAGWNGAEYAAALRHDQNCPAYNPHLRQLLHVAYKVAAEMGQRYQQALAEAASTVAAGVTENLYQRHVRQVFMD